ncbi:MAG: AbrB/MazE/SpoVT family DNA-binding domain-containing protein [Candidatus Micrarchaeota archaeon]
MQFVMTIGPKGQVVIPKAFRDEFKLFPGEEVLISNENKQLEIKKKSEQMEKIAAEINEYVHKYGKKHYEPIDIEKICDEELFEDMKRWKLP